MKTYGLLLVFLLSATAMWALNPSRTYKQKPEKYNMEYKELKVKTNDGKATLKAWYFPTKIKKTKKATKIKKATKTTGLILIAHNGEGNMADYLRRVDMFRSTYNVVIFDYRGYGESSEFEIDNNMYIYPQFQNDMETMIDFCAKNYGKSFNIYGWGIGAGLGLSTGFQRKEIKKIIADTPFLSMEDLESRFEDWDEPMEVPLADYDKKYEPIHALSQPPAGKYKKVQLIIGSNDRLFTKKDMEKLQTIQKGIVKNIHVVENPDRKDNFQVNTKAYFKAISTFLNNK